MEQHRNRIKTRKIGQQSTSFRQTNRVISGLLRLLLASRVALFKAPCLGTIHGYIMTKREIPHSAFRIQSEKGNLKSAPKLDQAFISTGFSN